MASIAYPAAEVAEAVSSGEHERGLVACGTGLRMALTADAVSGVGAVTAHDPYSAERARQSEDVQVLTMGTRVIASRAAEKVLHHWEAGEDVEILSRPCTFERLIAAEDDGNLDALRAHDRSAAIDAVASALR